MVNTTKMLSQSVKNVMTRMIAGISLKPGAPSVSRADYELARSRLSTIFSAVMVQEILDDSMSLLVVNFGWSVPPLVSNDATKHLSVLGINSHFFNADILDHAAEIQQGFYYDMLLYSDGLSISRRQTADALKSCESRFCSQPTLQRLQRSLAWLIRQEERLIGEDASLGSDQHGPSRLVTALRFPPSLW